MKLPSIQKVSHDMLETLRRFPLPLTAASIGTVAAVLIIGHEGPAQATILWSLLFGGILGTPLLTAVTLTVEKRKWRPPTGWGVKTAAVLLVVAYAATIPQDLTNAPAFHAVRLLILAFAAHLFVAIAPFSTKDQINGFWHFNKTLFLRILISALFAHVVFAGLAFALAALDNLFGMNIPGERYGQLWALVAGLFTTAFFLAGVPENLDELDTFADFPKGLRVFAQYILLPIVIVYLVILYAYIAKILFSWDWPQGWVSKLILGFSATGILSLLLLFPISRQSTDGWIRALTRWFYAILIPAVVMLFLAVWRRVSEYGITEGRYLAIALGLWLVILIVYFLFSSRKSIKFIPASLCVGTLLMCCGPWGVFNVSEQSQVSRLETILSRNSILVDARVKKASAELPPTDTREISAVLSYLHDMHGYESVQPWFGDPLREDTTKPGVGYRSAESVVALMGLKYLEPQRVQGNVTIMTAAEEKPWEIKGFDYLARSQRVHAGSTGEEIRSGRISYRVSVSLDTLTVVLHQGVLPVDSVHFAIGNAVRVILNDRDNQGTDNIPPAAMSLTASSERLRAKVCLPEVRLERNERDVKLLGYTVNILYALEGEQE